MRSHKHMKMWLILPSSGKSVLYIFIFFLQLWLCDKKSFSRAFKVFTRYGKCYTFNAAADDCPPLLTTKGGMGNGLELMLDIQQDEYLPVWGETGEGHAATSLTAARVKDFETKFLTLFDSLQKRRRLKLGSKCRFTAKMSLPS